MRPGSYVAFGVLAVLVAYFTSFSRFLSQDDEGYVILSLREFLHGGALYHSVYTQYGPFPYELWGAVFKLLGRTVTPDNGRAILIAIWVVTSLLVGVVAERLTRRLTLGLAAAVVAFAAGNVIANEPMHPDGLSALVLVGIAAAAVLLARRPRVQMSVIGVLVATLLMTKINIGGSAALAVAFAVCAGLPALGRVRWLTAAVAGLAVLMPFVVMSHDLTSAWAENFAVIIALSAASLGVVFQRRRVVSEDVSLTPVIVLVGAALVTIVVIAVIIIALGTSPSELIHGVLIGPLAQPSVFTLPATIPAAAVDLGVVGLLWAIGTQLIPSHPHHSVVAGAARILAGLAMWLWIAGALPFTLTPDPGALAVCLALAWLAASPPAVGAAADEVGPLVRFLVTALPVLGTVVVYPVAGSQLGFAALTFIPAGALILADGLAQVRGWSQTRPGLTGARFAPVATLGTLAVLAVLTFQALIQPLVLGAYSYRHLERMPFAGVVHVRQPTATVSAFAGVVGVLRSNCDTFVTLPGLNSFYIWSSINPPTGLNATSWMYLMDTGQQQQIVDALGRYRRVCLVRNYSILGDWTTGANEAPLPARPLMSYVSQTASFRSIYTAGGYEVLIRRS